MEEKIFNLIKNENKYKPYSDKEIAEKLNISRENVTAIRHKLKIPNSRKRLNSVIFVDAKIIIKENKDISHRKLTELLNKKGYSISRAKALEIIKQIKSLNKYELSDDRQCNRSYNKNNTINTKEEKDSHDLVIDSFQKLIGCNNSLKMQITQAKAAILYPPRGLHTLLLGPSGCGKNFLAELMYEFSINSGMISKEAPFITFNCADYTDNSHLLLAQLFGYVKGAFTGADSDKKGIVDKADGGILFLDEVHRLPSEGQEILFSMLDKGYFRRLGETEKTRKVNLMIIAATTENPENVLLLTFRRRIPMVIQIPSLNQRPMEERLDLIKYFLKEEGNRIQKDIIVDTDALRALLLYDCPGNIGQLKSDIQVGCARGLLNCILNKNDIVNIGVSELANHVRIGIRSNERSDEIATQIIDDRLVFKYNDSDVHIDINDDYNIANRIYNIIENRYKELEDQGLKASEINSIVIEEVEKELENSAKSFRISNKIRKDEIKNLVGPLISKIADECYNIAKKFYINLQNGFYYSLAIHLSATIERIYEGKKITNRGLDEIKEKYNEEYKVAQIISNRISNKLSIQLPEEEIGFIALYIKKFSKSTLDNSLVNVIILTHGQVGISMADVVNKILNTNHAIGLEMKLDENPKQALDRTIEIVRNTDKGKGTILLVDMGSLTAFGNVITQRTGIKVKVIDRVDTILALEITRKSLIPEITIDDIIENVEINDRKNKMHYNNKNNPKAIITICLTGEGTAQKIEEYIQKLLSSNGEQIKIFALGLISNISIDMSIKGILNYYNVIAVVGTIDPQIPGLEFISVKDLFEKNGKNKIIDLAKKNTEDDIQIDSILDTSMLFLDKDIKTKKEAINYILNKANEKEYINEKFIKSVYDRETMLPTYINGGIAVPHGLPQYVTKPGIFILRCKDDILWGNNGEMVKLIFLILYKENSKKIFLNIYKALLNQDFIRLLKSVRKKENIISSIKKYVII